MLFKKTVQREEHIDGVNDVSRGFKGCYTNPTSHHGTNFELCGACFYLTYNLLDNKDLLFGHTRIGNDEQGAILKRHKSLIRELDLNLRDTKVRDY